MVEHDDRRKHLEFIQAVISRMAGASATSKGWLLPVVTATYGYALTKPARSVALLGLAAVVLFGFIDTNYLKQERAFRRLFDAVAAGAELPPFCMNPAQVPRATDAAGHRICRTYRRVRRSVLLSWAIAPLYVGLIGIGVLIYLHVRS
jgi:histidine triad (HIT) family protein